MIPASFDASALFATDHGSAEWNPDGQLRVTLGERAWTVTPEDVAALREATQPLARQVYRCNCDCRWQLRVDGHTTVVLDSDEVLRLDALLEGTVAMLELQSILEDAAIAAPSPADRQ